MTAASGLGEPSSVLVSTSVLHLAIAVTLVAALAWSGSRRLPEPPYIETGVAVLVVGTASLFWSAGRGVEPGPLTAALVQSAWVVVVAAYPDPRLLSHRWRFVVLAAVVAVWTGALAGSALLVAGGFAGGVVLALLGQVMRFRRTTSVRQRQAMKWFLVGLVPAAAVLVGPPLVVATASLPDDALAGRWYPALCTAAVWYFLAAATAGLVIGGRWQVERLLGATLVTTGTVLLVAWAYWLSLPAAEGPVAVSVAVVTGLVAVRALEAASRRVVWAGDTSAAVQSLAERLEAAVDPSDVPEELAAAARRGLGVAHAVVDLGDDPATPRPDSEAFPVRYQGRQVATMHVAPRPGETMLSARDRRDLARLVAGAAPALDAAATHQRLRSAHARLVAAREEERRRLRREAHDDLAPTLAGLSLTAAAAAELVGRDPARSVAVHRTLADGIGAAVQQVRDIAYDLRPPVLDDRGLLAAVHERVVAADLEGPSVEVHGDCPDELPAAVGSAALRIVQEAVTNTRRHAAASACRVQLDRRQDTLVILVQDDGHGLPPGVGRGVGLLAMEERAEEVGGTLEVDTGPWGTTVRAVLPLTPSTS